MTVAQRLTILAMATLLATGASGSREAAAADTVKIGYSGTLTGPVSFLGNDMKAGAEMATEEINAKGGVRGRKIELIIRDDQHDPVKTVANYREIIEREGAIAMLGATNSASMLAVAPLINDQYKIPVICTHTDANDIIENQAWKDQKDNYLFRIGMSSHGQGNFLIDSVVKKFGFHKVALLTWTAGWGQIGRHELQRRLNELGMKPVADETFDSGDTDMTAQLLRIRAAGADVIVNYGVIQEAVAIFKSQRKIGGEILPFVSAWGIAVPALERAAGPLAEGTIDSSIVTADGPQPEARQAVIDAYRKKYGHDFGDQAGFFGSYDAVNMFAQVMEKVGFEPAVVRNALENQPNFKGIVLDINRPPFTRERHDSFTEDDMMLGRWTDGKYLPISFDSTGPYVMPQPGQKRYMNANTFVLN